MKFIEILFTRLNAEKVSYNITDFHSEKIDFI